MNTAALFQGVDGAMHEKHHAACNADLVDLVRVAPHVVSCTDGKAVHQQNGLHGKKENHRRKYCGRGNQGAG